MKTKNLLFFSAFFLFSASFFACNLETSNKLPEIHFDDISAIDLKHEIPLDSIVERTEIIRFTSDSLLIIGKIRTVFESKDNFFLIADNRILRFDKTGKFLNIIGREGKGPGEHIAVWMLDADEVNQFIYVMDYFGRKMLCYHFDGSFVKQFNLPENFAVNGFRLYNGNILYTSETNSVSPEIYFYDQNKDKLTEISTCDREMLPGEAFMGANFLMGNMEHPFLFHYFNDTVFSIVDKQLIPSFLLKFGKLKSEFADLIIESGKKPDGPRAQVYDVVMGGRFTFVQYGVTKLDGTRLQTQVTGIFSNDFSFYSPSVNLISDESPLLNIHSGKGLNAGYGNSLLITISPLEVLEIEPDFDIAVNDNPLLIKYYLR